MHARTTTAPARRPVRVVAAAWLLLCGGSVLAGSGSVAADEAPAPTAAEPAPDEAVAAAGAYEWNRARRGSPPDSTLCATFDTGGGRRNLACFEHDGDKIWVYDGRADGRSATAAWNHHLGGGLYRQGACVSTLGAGEWGVCNKDFPENSSSRTSRIDVWACNYEAQDNTWHGCGDPVLGYT